MRKERNALKVGSITIVVLALFFMVLIWVSKGVGGEMQTIVIHFRPTPAMPTLVSGSAVLVGGQNVGQVVEAELMPVSGSVTRGDSAAVDFYLHVEVEMRSELRLHSDCSAFAESPPLGGDGIIKIDLGTATVALGPDAAKRIRVAATGQPASSKPDTTACCICCPDGRLSRPITTRG